MEPSASSSTDAALLAKITERNVGVYRLVLGSVDRVKSKSSSKTAGLQEVISALKRMFRDVHSVDPRLFALYFAAKSWDGINASISTYASNRILQTIEAGLLRQHVFIYELLIALFLRHAISVLVSHVARKSAQVRSNMRRTVMAHFQVLLLESNLRLQTSEAQDLEMTDRPGAISARSTWAAFEYFAFFFTTALSALSQLVVLYTAISSMNYIVLCVGLIPPIILHVNPFSLKNMIGFAYTINQDYIRARCLDKLLTARYRQDVVSGNLGGWIVTEYKRVMAELRDVSDEDPFNQVHMPSAFDTFITELVDDLPTVLFGMGAMASSNQFSMANLAILQSSCRSLRTTVSWFLQADEKLKLSAQRVVQMYQTIDKAKRKTGYDPVPYPIPEAKGRGMDFELRNVRYEYPGSKTKTPALDNLSFRIPAGSTVVVVGSNGSGKSTLVRILAQLYHPTGGELVIDGHPATAYDILSLRQAVALLSQDNLVYPFSLRENIGLGCSELKDDIHLIEDSAERGGAAEFIGKLKSGYDTMLNPMTMAYAINEWKQPDHPILKRMGDLDQAIDISGGERQRLVAARCFMRLHSGKVTFIAVDEPSSALDAEAELKLFHNLLQAREGKTLLFVTHRFGHLTQFADKILCMKDGSLIEQGTHDELMRLDGEYANLYKIQAGAFADGPASALKSEVVNVHLSI